MERIIIVRRKLSNIVRVLVVLMFVLTFFSFNVKQSYACIRISPTICLPSPPPPPPDPNPDPNPNPGGGGSDCGLTPCPTGQTCVHTSITSSACVEDGGSSGGNCLSSGCPSGYACVTNSSSDDYGQCTGAGSPSGGRYTIKAYLKTVPSAYSSDDYWNFYNYDTGNTSSWSSTFYSGYDYFLAQNVGQCQPQNSCTEFSYTNPSCLQLTDYSFPIVFRGGEICKQPSPTGNYADFPSGDLHNNLCRSGTPGYTQGYSATYGWGGFVYPQYDKSLGLTAWGVTYDVGNKYRWNPTTQKFNIVDSINPNHSRIVTIRAMDGHQGIQNDRHQWFDDNCHVNESPAPSCELDHLIDPPSGYSIAVSNSSYWTYRRSINRDVHDCDYGGGLNHYTSYDCYIEWGGTYEVEDFKPEDQNLTNIVLYENNNSNVESKRIYYNGQIIDGITQAFDISVQVSGDYAFLGEPDIYDITDPNDEIKLTLVGWSCSEGHRNKLEHTQLLAGNIYRVEQIDVTEPFRIAMKISLAGGGGMNYNIPLLYPYYPSRQQVSVDTYNDSSANPVNISTITATGVVDPNKKSPIDKTLTAAWTDLDGNNMLCSGGTCWKFLAAGWKNTWANNGLSFELVDDALYGNALAYNGNIYPWSDLDGNGAGPTSAWSGGNGQPKSICNHNICWILSEDVNGIKNLGTPFDISASKYWIGPDGDKDYTVNKFQNKYPWSDFGDGLGAGPTTGWNAGGNNVAVCNRTICWMWRGGLDGIGWDDAWTQDMKDSINWQGSPNLTSGVTSGTGNRIYDDHGMTTAWNTTEGYGYHVCRENGCITWNRGVAVNWSSNSFDISQTNLQKHLPGFDFDITDPGNVSHNGFTSQSVNFIFDPNNLSSSSLNVQANSSIYPTGNSYIGHAFSLGDYGFETGNLDSVFPIVSPWVYAGFTDKSNDSALHKEGNKFLVLSGKSALINPGFEEGGGQNDIGSSWTAQGHNNTGWFNGGNGTYERYGKWWNNEGGRGAKYGSYSLHIKSPTDGTTQRVIQWAPLYWSTKAKLSAWLRGRGAGGNLKFDEYCIDNSGSDHYKNSYHFSAGNSNEWGYHEQEITLANDCVSDHRMAVYMDLTAAGQEIWADDINVSDTTPYVGSKYLDVGLRNLVSSGEPLTFSFWARAQDNLTLNIPILSEPIDASGNYNWAVYNNPNSGETWSDVMTINVGPEWKFFSKTSVVDSANLHTDKVRFNLTALPYGSGSQTFSNPKVYYDDINIMRGGWNPLSAANNLYSIDPVNEKTLVKIGMEQRDHTPSFTFSGNQCLSPAYDSAGLSNITGEITFANNSTPDASGFVWDFGDGTSSEPQAIGDISNPIDHAFSDSGNYSVTLTASYSDGTPPNSFFQDVTIYKPVAAFTPTNSSDYDINVDATDSQASPASGSLSYNWSFPGANPGTDTGQTVIANYSDGGSKDITLEVAQIDGANTCYAQTTQPVTPSACPVAPTFSSPTEGDYFAEGSPVAVNWSSDDSADAQYTVNYSTDNWTTFTSVCTKSYDSSQQYSCSFNFPSGISGGQPLQIKVFASSPVGCEIDSVAVRNINARIFPWYQITKGDVYAEKLVGISGSIFTTLPDTSKYFIPPSPSKGFVSSKIDFSSWDNGFKSKICSESGNPSDNQCLAIGNSSYSDKEYNYDYFVRKLDGKESNLSDFNNFTNSGIYKFTGAQSFSGDASSKKFILLVPGDVTISGDITTSGGGVVVIITSGDINVDYNVKNLHGFYIADGKITTGHNSSGFDNQLVINGGLISWDSADGVDLQRDLGSASNADTPAELFNGNPEMLHSLYNSPELGGILISPSVWQEVAP